MIIFFRRLSEAKVNNFFLRQCTVAVKLLGNLVRWQGILSDNILSEIALDSLLNRYLLSAIRTCSPLQAANICQMVRFNFFFMDWDYILTKLWINFSGVCKENILNKFSTNFVISLT